MSTERKIQLAGEIGEFPEHMTRGEYLYDREGLLSRIKKKFTEAQYFFRSSGKSIKEQIKSFSGNTEIYVEQIDELFSKYQDKLHLLVDDVYKDDGSLPEHSARSVFEQNELFDNREVVYGIPEYAQSIAELRDGEAQWKRMLDSLGIFSTKVENRRRTAEVLEAENMAASLDYYFRLLEEHLPGLHALVEKAGSELHERNPLPAQTKNVIMSAAYVGEQSLVSFLQQMREQNLTDAELFLFLNGPDDDKHQALLLQRNKELTDYLDSIRDEDPEFCKKVRVASGLFQKEDKRYGQFKGMMGMLAGKMLQKAGVKGKVALQALDADMVYMDHNFIKEVTENIQQECHYFGQGDMNVDPVIAAQNINLYLTQEVSARISSLLLEQRVLEVGLPGGNSFFDASAYFLAGGHNFYQNLGEDFDLRKRLDGLVMSSLSFMEDEQATAQIAENYHNFIPGGIRFDGDREKITFVSDLPQNLRYSDRSSYNEGVTGDSLVDSKKIDEERVVFDVMLGLVQFQNFIDNVPDRQSEVYAGMTSILEDCGISGISSENITDFIIDFKKQFPGVARASLPRFYEEYREQLRTFINPEDGAKRISFREPASFGIHRERFDIYKLINEELAGLAFSAKTKSDMIQLINNEVDTIKRYQLGLDYGVALDADTLMDICKAMIEKIKTSLL